MSIQYVTDSTPRWASAPGATILKLLRSRGLTPDDLADQLRLSDPDVRRLIHGELEINEDLAEGLSTVLGSTATFWCRREEQYRDSVTWLEVDDLVQRSPLVDLIGRGWVEEASGWRDQAKALLDYYDVSDAAEWTARWETRLSDVHFRTSGAYESDDLSLAAWLRQVELRAEEIEVGPWSPSGLRSAIEELRGFSRISNPERFLPLASATLAQVGVALIAVPATPGNRLSGSAFALESGTRVVGLTARHRSDDHFWFTLFHELGHLLLHGNQGEFLDTLDADESGDSVTESEANAFARDALLPHGVDSLRDLRANGPRMREIIAFANAEGIAPGIVVGRLQYDGVLRHNQLQGLIRRFKWEGSTLKT